MSDKEEIIKKVWKEIESVEDPEIGMTLVELGLIYDINVDDNGVADVVMTFTSMGCPFGPQLQAETQVAAARTEGITDANVEVVFSPPWDPHTMASEDAKMTLGIY